MSTLLKAALFPALACSLAAAAPPPPTIEQALIANRHSLTLTDGQFGGDGGAILKQAVADSRFVALGEDHFTVEEPAMEAALCDLMAPDLAGLVLEVGPIAMQAVDPILRGKDRLQRMAEFDRRYPNAVAFLDSRADNDAAAHCARVSKRQSFKFVGLDQEFLGAAGLTVDRILATRLSPSARRTILKLRDEERADAAEARVSGDPGKLLLTRISEARIGEVETALAQGGTPEARRLFAGLVDSARIYAKDSAGAFDSNLVRSLLMKRQFEAQAPKTGKLLFKFGDFHLYKGTSPRGIRDLGNHLAELAEGQGQTSLHITFLGAKGVHATFGGYARPLGRAPFVMVEDSDYPWLKSATEAMMSDGWTLFDLRPLRLHRIKDVPSEWRRLIDGYDLLVLAPTFSPSEFVAP